MLFRSVRDVYEYTLETGAAIRATPDHKFMTQAGEMVAIDEIFRQGLELEWVDVSQLAARAA